MSHDELDHYRTLAIDTLVDLAELADKAECL
jgi:hypothetical protein